MKKTLTNADAARIVFDAMAAMDVEINAKRQQDPETFRILASLVADFQKAHPEYALVPTPDGKGLIPANRAMYFALDHVVRRLASDPANDGAGRDGVWFLNEAHKVVQEHRAAGRLEDLVLPTIMRLWDAVLECAVTKALDESERESLRKSFLDHFLGLFVSADKRKAVRARLDVATIGRSSLQ